MSRFVSVVFMSSLLLLLGVGCGDDHHDDGHSHGDAGGHSHGDAGGHSHEDPVGVPSGAECPSGSTLTYSNFGEQFFESYCLRCHSSDVSGNARMGAPADHDFDTLGEIELFQEHIDQLAAFGPDSENDAMPPGGASPSDDERLKLGEWIACGLKE